MTLVEFAPFVGAVIVVGACAWVAARTSPMPRQIWVAPALLCAAFLAWSVLAVVTEGPTGFWPEHTRNLWGNQIWFDLLLAAGVGWFFMAPQAREQGMRPFIWLAVVALSGSIGLLAMMTRLLYLQKNRPQKR